MRYGQLTASDVHKHLAAISEKRAKRNLQGQRAPQMAKPHCLDGTTLAELVKWYEKGHLTNKELAAAKQALLATLV